MILVKSLPLKCTKTSSLFVECDVVISTNNLKQKLADVVNINAEYFTLHRAGKLLQSDDIICDNEIVHVHIPLVGGKGGFGSMLRAIGAQIEKTTNKEACRDLSGRRLRDINEEQRLKKWIAKQADREKEREEKRQQRMQRLLEKPKHKFHDPEYDKVISNLASNVGDAVYEGLKKVEKTEGDESTSKRKAEETITKPLKKLKGWDMDGDLDGLSSSDSDDDENSQSSSNFTSTQIDSESQNSNSRDDPRNQEANEGDERKESEPLSIIDQPSSSTSSTPFIKKDSKPVIEINLDDYETIDQLQDVGLESLKLALQKRGMKCGGTARQRAERLFSLKSNISS